MSTEEWNGRFRKRARNIQPWRYASQEQMGELAAGKGTPISGAGTGTVLRDADRLAAQYGGKPVDWQKVASENYNPGGAKGGGFETHAYQNVKTGQVVEMKSKMQ